MAEKFFALTAFFVVLVSLCYDKAEGTHDRTRKLPRADHFHAKTRRMHHYPQAKITYRSNANRGPVGHHAINAIADGDESDRMLAKKRTPVGSSQGKNRPLQYAKSITFKTFNKHRQPAKRHHDAINEGGLDLNPVTEPPVTESDGIFSGLWKKISGVFSGSKTEETSTSDSSTSVSGMLSTEVSSQASPQSSSTAAAKVHSPQTAQNKTSKQKPGKRGSKEKRVKQAAHDQKRSKPKPAKSNSKVQTPVKRQSLSKDSANTAIKHKRNPSSTAKPATKKTRAENSDEKKADKILDELSDSVADVLEKGMFTEPTELIADELVTPLPAIDAMKRDDSGRVVVREAKSFGPTIVAFAARSAEKRQEPYTDPEPTIMAAVDKSEKRSASRQLERRQELYTDPEPTIMAIVGRSEKRSASRQVERRQDPYPYTEYDLPNEKEELEEKNKEGDSVIDEDKNVKNVISKFVEIVRPDGIKVHEEQEEDVENDVKKTAVKDKFLLLNHSVPPVVLEQPGSDHESGPSIFEQPEETLIPEIPPNPKMPSEPHVEKEEELQEEEAAKSSDEEATGNLLERLRTMLSLVSEKDRWKVITPVEYISEAGSIRMKVEDDVLYVLVAIPFREKNEKRADEESQKILDRRHSFHHGHGPKEHVAAEWHPVPTVEDEGFMDESFSVDRTKI